ncbi:MAG: class I SAM-dependent methyltransferase [Candidatus Parcubacteria bacterium]|nr:class I SAM-dependent methyltransferase [Candidatus Parcubacteria bacterium]
MKYDPKKVKKRYDKIADEEDRSEKNPTLRTEIPREFIKKYIRKTDIVLDAGGGTGINAIMMAKQCKHVSLIDISTEIINYARKNVKNAKLSNKIDLFEGDISNLKQFKDGQFSFVVCVGDSISYVLENRFKAINELIRVAKKSSILIIGCDSKYGFMRQYLRDGNLEETISIYKNHETYCSMGPRTHVYDIDEMKQLLEKNGCKILEIASTPTITDAVDKKQYHEPKKWAKLKKLEMQICIKPELLGTGSHLLFIAKKK